MNEMQLLCDKIKEINNTKIGSPRTKKLLSEGIIKASKKLGEEAIEAALAGSAHNRDELIKESADLLYNLAVVWELSGITLEDVEKEQALRRQHIGIAEKRPKGHLGTEWDIV